MRIGRIDGLLQSGRPSPWRAVLELPLGVISSPSTRLRDDVEHVWRPWYAAGRMTIRGERRKSEVVVTADGAPLDWRSSLAVRNHSPTRPAWGYGGSGAAQLELAIQTGADRRGDGRAVLSAVQVGRHRADRGGPLGLNSGDVLGWLQSAAGTDEVVRLAVVEER